MSDTITSTTSHSYTCDAANRLTARDSSSYTSDANGNTLTDANHRTNIWDSQNRLFKCVVSGGSTTEFTYGTDGLRHRKFVTDSGGAQTQTDYVIDGQNVVEEIVKHRTSSTASWGTATTVSYLQGPQGPLYRLSSAATDPSWYVYDGLGSVVGEVSVTGTLTASESRDVYGNLRTSAGTSTTSHGFVGGLGHQTDDETGLVYMRARYYDPQTGRFISEDPAQSGENWFTYANTDPVNNVDSTGKAPDPSQYIFSLMNSWMGMDNPFRLMVADDLDELAAGLMAKSEAARRAAAKFTVDGARAFVKYNAALSANDPRAGQFYAEMAGSYGFAKLASNYSALVCFG